MVIKDKISQLESIDVNRILDETLKEIDKFILNLNKEQLYEKGEINVKEPAQREEYSEAYKRVKERKATYKKTEFVTLRFDGNFYDSFKLIIFEKEFIISATDLKWNWHENNPRFTNALGLTEESKGKLRAELLPIFIEKLKKEIK
jgi:hypothetical protein